MEIDLAGAVVALEGDTNPIADAALAALRANGGKVAADPKTLADIVLISCPLRPGMIADDPRAMHADVRKIAASMAARERGRIVFLMSALAGMPMRRHPKFSMENASILAGVRTLAMEFGPKVLVNAVGIGMVEDVTIVSGDKAMLSHIAARPRRNRGGSCRGGAVPLRSDEQLYDGPAALGRRRLDRRLRAQLLTLRPSPACMATSRFAFYDIPHAGMEKVGWRGSPVGGEKKPPERIGVREIAKRVGVAPMTVSRVLSNPDMVSPETRAKILDAIEKAGFVPNRLASSMRGTGRMIGTVVPPLINSGIAEQVQGMSDECHESGYSMLLVQGEFTQEAEEKSIRTLLGWRPAGMILQSFVQSDAARALLRSSGAPVVEISEIKGRKPLDMVVGVSNFETAYAMTMHLAAKGYKRIGFVSTPIHGNDRLQQRRTGYHAALVGTRHQEPWRHGGRGADHRAGRRRGAGDADRPAQGHRRHLLFERHAGGRRDPGMPPPPLGRARPHRHCRLRRHGSRRPALSAADHGQGQPLRDGHGARCANCWRGSRGDRKSPTITSLGFEIVDRESA